VTYSRGFFQDLLVSALDTAVTLEKVNSVTKGICKDLDLNVARGDQVLFNQTGEMEDVSK